MFSDKINLRAHLTNSISQNESVFVPVSSRCSQFSQSSLLKRTVESPGCCSKIWNGLKSIWESIKNFFCCSKKKAAQPEAEEKKRSAEAKEVVKEKEISKPVEPESGPEKMVPQERKKPEGVKCANNVVSDLKSEMGSLLQRLTSNLLFNDDEDKTPCFEKSVLILTYHKRNNPAVTYPYITINCYKDTGSLQSDKLAVAADRWSRDAELHGSKHDLILKGCLIGQQTRALGGGFTFFCFENGAIEWHKYGRNSQKIPATLKQFCGHQIPDWVHHRWGTFAEGKPVEAWYDLNV